MSSFSSTYPSVSPSYQIDFSNGKRIPPNATFSRSDSPIDASKAAASAVHYWSNEKSLSSENLLLDSKTGTGNWTGDSSGSALVPVVTANHAASPDGTASQATRVQLDLNGSTTGSDYARYYQSHNVASGTSATFAVWMKSTDGASSYAAQILSPAGPGEAVTITGSWQKFTVTGSSVGNITYGVRLRGGQTPTNADTADILIWGANLSTTGQTVLSETTTQIHRQYSPTLKSVATAGAARFEYDPTDGQSEGILIEGQSTNLLNRSEELDNAYWSKNRVTVTANAAVAPNGTLAADLVVADATGASESHNLQKVYSFTSGSTYTLCVYAKAKASHSKFRLRAGNPATWAAQTTFVLSGDGSTVDNDYGTAAIQSCGNGWYRCSITGTAGASAATNLLFSLVDSSGNTSFEGDDYSGVLLWGAQFEEASFASSYLKVEGSTATRAADSLSASLADIGLTTGQDVTLYTEGDFGDPSNENSSRAASALRAGSTSYVMLYNGGNNSGSGYVRDGGTDQAYFPSGVTAGAFKAAISAKNNSFKYAANGTSGSEDTAGTVPQYTSLQIGGNGSSGLELDGHVKRVAVYGQSLSSSELAAITS